MPYTQTHQDFTFEHQNSYGQVSSYSKFTSEDHNPF